MTNKTAFAAATFVALSAVFQLHPTLAAPQSAELARVAAVSEKEKPDSIIEPPAARYAVSISDAEWTDAGRGRVLPVRIYCPGETESAESAGTEERFPVIVFSTGLGRSRTDCAYLGQHWAGCGYVAVFVQHPGSDKDARGLRPRKDLQRAFYSPDNTLNRPLDIIFVLDWLEQLSRGATSLGKRLDMTRVGASGHDFGSQTVLALAGQVLPGEIAFEEHRVKAVVAMSSPVPLGQVPLDEAYGNVSLPIFHITGTADKSIVATTQPSQRRLPFDYISAADQYLMTLQGGDHLTYSGHSRPSNSGNDAMFQHLIAESSTAFWDAYLKHDGAAKQWLVNGGLKNYLGATAQLENKLTR
jgi:predicted dienelactone hydrolase